MKTYNRLRAVIDLDAVMYNMQMMHENIKDDAQMIVVVKTDGYGHGAVPIADMLEDVDYVWGYAVATLDEGMVLRRAGIKKPILCLGCIFPDQMEEMIRHQIRMTTFDGELAALASAKAQELGMNAIFHIKIDTGMSRLGFAPDDDSVNEIEKISHLPHVELEGLFTHFSRADEKDKDITAQQYAAYLRVKEELEKRGIRFPFLHVSNSAAIIDQPEFNLNLVRAGISTYGLYPSEEVKKDSVPLKPAMEWIAHITYLKWIEKGTAVSYGGTFVADRRMRIATVPAGYGDGYPRSLSNKGYVLIHGQKAPIVGRVCMDQFMVDVTDIPDVKFGDKATLIGENEGAYLSVETLSELSGRFNYEFVCDINKRVPREYIRGGKVVAQTDYFN
ncbi:MAG: alanine racemase [Bariatricus sp.]